MSEKRRWKSWQKRLRDSTINSEQVDLSGDVMGNTPGANGNVKALSGCTKIQLHSQSLQNILPYQYSPAQHTREDTRDKERNKIYSTLQVIPKASLHDSISQEIQSDNFELDFCNLKSRECGIINVPAIVFPQRTIKDKKLLIYQMKYKDNPLISKRRDH